MSAPASPSSGSGGNKPFQLTALAASLAPPATSMEHLRAGAVLEEFARFAGIEDAATASRSCKRLRGPFNSDVVAMVSVAGLLRHRPRLALRNVRGRGPFEAVAAAISSGL